MEFGFLDVAGMPLLTAFISTVVSLAVTSFVLWFKRPKVQWVAVPTKVRFFRIETDRHGNFLFDKKLTDKTSSVVIHVEIHNVGDAVALNVGVQYTDHSDFAAALVASGASVQQQFRMDVPAYQTETLSISYTVSPVRLRRKMQVSCQFSELEAERFSVPLTR